MTKQKAIQIANKYIEFNEEKLQWLQQRHREYSDRFRKDPHDCNKTLVDVVEMLIFARTESKSAIEEMLEELKPAKKTSKKKKESA